MKHLNVILSDELHGRFKVAVALEGAEISEVIRKFLEEYVAKVEKKHKLKR